MRHTPKILAIYMVLIVIYLIARSFIPETGTDTAFAGLSYFTVVSFLALSMGIILSGCELFANGVECVGARLNISHATAGSLLAAVGTALPETMLPIIALLFGSSAHKEGIAVGAILGAPFMLSTLAMFFLGITTFTLYFFKKREKPLFAPNIKAFETDLLFFLPAMVTILIISLVGIRFLNYIGALILIITYVAFFRYALGHEAEVGEEYIEDFYFNKYLKCPSNLLTVILQIFSGLVVIVFGAHIFVEYVTVFSIKSGLPSLLLSLIIAPLATELPEKFNSITWTIKKKDTLGMANISGAMVFQATIPVSIGLLFTQWSLSKVEVMNIVFAIFMAFILLMVVKIKNTLPAWALLIGGVFYTLYIIYVFY